MLKKLSVHAGNRIGNKLKKNINTAILNDYNDYKFIFKPFWEIILIESNAMQSTR